MYEYKVAAFAPMVKGCGAQDKGWDEERCKQFEDFLAANIPGGWKLHSSDFRQVSKASGCGSTVGVRLVCVFERQK